MIDTADKLDDELVVFLRGFSPNAPREGEREKILQAATRISSLQAEIERLRLLVEESLFHLRLDARAEAYHNRALAELNTRARSAEHPSPMEEKE